MSKLLKYLPPERVLTPEEVLALADVDDLGLLLATAARRRDHGHGSVVSYSRKVFIPLTNCVVTSATTAPSRRRPLRKACRT